MRFFFQKKKIYAANMLTKQIIFATYDPADDGVFSVFNVDIYYDHLNLIL